MWSQRIARHAAQMKRRALLQRLAQTNVPNRIRTLKKRLPPEQQAAAIKDLWRNLSMTQEEASQPLPAQRIAPDQFSLLDSQPPPPLPRRRPTRNRTQSLKIRTRIADEKQQELFTYDSDLHN